MTTNHQSPTTNRVLILTGPTGSGKSAMALELAERVGGVILNADAMQVYRGLPILTAQPTEDEMARVPHRLYGVLEPTDACCVARWLGLVVPEIRGAWEAGHTPILVGGTGMYLKALMEGLAEIPEIPPEIREQVRASFSSPLEGERTIQGPTCPPKPWRRWKGRRGVVGGEYGEYREGTISGAPPTESSCSAKATQDSSTPPQGGSYSSLHAYLASIDPVMAERLHPGNTQRLMRATEVMLATGRSLADWQADPATPPLPEATFQLYAVRMPRELLYERINQRLESMMAQGALEEVRALRAVFGSSPLSGEQTIQDPTSRRGIVGEEENIHMRSSGALASRRTETKVTAGGRSPLRSADADRGWQADHPLLKACGVPELWAHLEGEMALEAAVAQAQRNTRRYAKRQHTWIRHQMPDAVWMEAGDTSRLLSLLG